MATIDQNELARQAEQLNDSQWYAFLDALDEVAKRRRQRESDVPDRPEDYSRDGIAAWIAHNHLLADSSVREIWYLPHGAENEIHLLEISERIESGGDELTPIDFAVDIEGVHYKLFVGDLTSDQLQQVKAGSIRLPPGWSLDGAKVVGRRGP
jgi:hypothetical protein